MKSRVTSILILLALLIISSVHLSAQENDTAFPVSIDHKFGTTTIEAEPQRIVVLGFTEQDPYFALGVTPIAIRYWYGGESAIFPWAEEFANGASPEVLTLTYGSLNYEAILALEPDLISAVDAGITAEEYEALSAIAPTLAQYDTYVDFGMPWQETTRLIGTAIGQADEADTLVSDVEARIESIREDNAQFEDHTVAVSYFVGGTYGYYTGQDSRGRFFTDLGFVVPEELDEIAGDSFFANISNERLDLLDQDLLVFLALQFFEDGSEAGREAIETDPLLAQLEAIQDERVLFVSDEFDDALQFSTILSIDYLLDGLLPELTEIFPPETDIEATEEVSDDSAFPMTIEHEVGTTTLETVPERIVVLEYSFADHLGTLGITPVGFAVDAPPEYIYAYTSDLGSIEVGTRAEPNLEAILELNPDLIIGDLHRHEAIYDQLSLIAPTLIFNSLRGNYTDQLEQFSIIAEIVDRETEAIDILNNYQANFDATVANTNTDASEFVIGVLWSGGFTAHSNQSFMGSFLESLGRVNALEPQGEETQYLLEMEGFASLNPSAIVILCSPADQEYLDERADDALWQAFDAVSNNRVYVFDRNLWSKGRGITAYNMILDDAVNSGLLTDTESQTTVCGGISQED
ncbi:MAG: hypothetical protein Phog2KO_28860 [Phototrophicaceae bacterium]